MSGFRTYVCVEPTNDVVINILLDKHLRIEISLENGWSYRGNDELIAYGSVKDFSLLKEALIETNQLRNITHSWLDSARNNILKLNEYLTTPIPQRKKRFSFRKPKPKYPDNPFEKLNHSYGIICSDNFKEVYNNFKKACK